MRILSYLFAFAAIAGQAASPQEAPFCATVLQSAQTEFSNSGVLKNSEGFVYIDLDDDSVHKLVALIEKKGFVEPPYFGNADLVGAHISVVYPDEMEKYHIDEIQECGEVI